MLKFKANCKFLLPNKECKATRNKTCNLCAFYRIIGETDDEYKLRKYAEKKRRDEKGEV